MNQWTPKGQKQIDPHESLTTEERAYPEELFSASWVPNQCGESLTRWSKVSHHTPSIYNSFAIHIPFIYHSFTIHLPFIYHWFNEHQRGFNDSKSVHIVASIHKSYILATSTYLLSEKQISVHMVENTERYLMDSILHKPNLHHNVLVCLILKWVPLMWCILLGIQAPPNVVKFSINNPMARLVHQGRDTILAIKGAISISWLNKGGSGYVLQKEYQYQ